MSWLSDIWGAITGNNSNQVAQQQQQNFNLQQQQFQQQQAEAERQRQAMQADEDRRQQNIRGGTSAIEQAFAQFNDPWFKGAQDKYSAAYLPQIDEQAGNARNDLIARLFERGMLESSVGANALGDLEKKRLDERVRVGAEAADFASGLREKVNQQKNSLFDVARSAADPNAVASRATGDAAALAAMPGGSYQNQSGLGDVFASVLEPFAYGLVGYQNRLPQNYRPSGGVNAGSSLKLFG